MEKYKIPNDKPLYVYMKELKENIMKENESKYNLIMEFLNKSMNLKLKSICDVKQFDIEKVNKNLFFDILNDYKDKLIVELGVEIDEYKMDVIDVISVCVNSINYSVYRKHVVLEKKKRNLDSPEDPPEKIKKKKIFISILNKPKKPKKPRSKPTSLKKMLNNNKKSDNENSD